MGKEQIKKSIDDLQDHVDTFGGIGTQRTFHRKIADILLAAGADTNWLYDDYLIQKKDWKKV